MPPPVGIERSHLQPLLQQHVQVDVGDRRLVRHRKPFGLGQSVAVLEHRGLPVPGQVGGGFPRPRRGIQVCSKAPRRLGTAQQSAGFGLADGDVAGRQVRQHRCARDRRLAAGRVWHPDVLADLGMDDEAAQVGCSEQQVSAERRGARRQG